MTDALGFLKVCLVGKFLDGSHIELLERTSEGKRFLKRWSRKQSLQVVMKIKNVLRPNFIFVESWYECGQETGHISLS